MITEDGVGRNGSRVRLLLSELQKLADETGPEIPFCHFPPGTSKWNRAGRWLFPFYHRERTRQTLAGLGLIVNPAPATTTRAGPRAQCYFGTAKYTKAIKVRKREFAAIRLRPAPFMPNVTTPPCPVYNATPYCSIYP